MKIYIDYNGKTYASKSIEDMTAETISEKLFDTVTSMEKFKMELEDGGFLLIGETALKSCVFRVIETEKN